MKFSKIILLVFYFVVSILWSLAHADIYEVVVAEKWTQVTVNGELTNTPNLCQTYHCIQYEDITTQPANNIGKDLKFIMRAITDEYEKMVLDGVMILSAEKLNENLSPIEPTQIWECTDDKILTKEECEKSCEIIPDIMGGYEVCEEWRWKMDIPYDHPEGRDKTISVADTLSVNTYLGTSVNLTGMTKDEATKALIPIVKEFKAKAVVIEP